MSKQGGCPFPRLQPACRVCHPIPRRLPQGALTPHGLLLTSPAAPPPPSSFTCLASGCLYLAVMPMGQGFGRQRKVLSPAPPVHHLLCSGVSRTQKLKVCLPELRLPWAPTREDPCSPARKERRQDGTAGLGSGGGGVSAPPALHLEGSG